MSNLILISLFFFFSFYMSMHYSRYIRKQDFFAQKKKKKTRLQVFKSSAFFFFFKWEFALLLVHRLHQVFNTFFLFSFFPFFFFSERPSLALPSSIVTTRKDLMEGRQVATTNRSIRPFFGDQKEEIWSNSTLSNRSSIPNRIKSCS